MGCDIHLAAEVLNDDGKWEHVDPPIEVCEFCKGTGSMEAGPVRTRGGPRHDRP